MVFNFRILVAIDCINRGWKGKRGNLGSGKLIGLQFGISGSPDLKLMSSGSRTAKFGMSWPCFWGTALQDWTGSGDCKFGNGGDWSGDCKFWVGRMIGSRKLQIRSRENDRGLQIWESGWLSRDQGLQIRAGDCKLGVGGLIGPWREGPWSMHWSMRAQWSADSSWSTPIGTNAITIGHPPISSPWSDRSSNRPVISGGQIVQLTTNH